jgi:AcrR family transcriptional regulator
MARPRQITDEQIIEATRAAIVEQGSQVPLDAVAQKLGVTAPALLKRFGSRQQLLLVALKPDPAEIEAALDVPVDDRPAAEQIFGILERLSTQFTRTFPRVMALRECGLSPQQMMDEVKRPMPTVAIGAVSRWLQALAARGLIELHTPEVAATAMVGSVSTRLMSSYLSRQTVSRRAQLNYLREVSALFSRALEPTSRARSRGAPSPSPKERSVPARSLKKKSKKRTAQS